MSNISNVIGALELSVSDISARSGLSKDRVAEILQGRSVNQFELRALSNGLNIPIRSFAEGIVSSHGERRLNLLFRNTKIEKSTNFQSAIEQVYNFVDGALKVLPARGGIPSWINNFTYFEETYTEAEKLAYKFREYYYQEKFDEPATDLPNILLRRTSTIIGYMPRSRYEGASIISGGYSFIFISPRFPGRMLFTLAHELGHLIAHHRESDAAVFDKPSQIGGAKRKDKSESFVDMFASVFLMPERGVAIALKKIREMYGVRSDQLGDVEIIVLARLFGVSFEAAAYRCENLELLPTGGAKALYDHLRKEHGGPEKRADQLGLPPRINTVFPKISPLLVQHINKLISSGDISVGWAADQFGLSIDDIYSGNSGVGNREFHC